jgi:hypothetical protein
MANINNTVYVAMIHSFKDPSELGLQVFKEEDEAVKYCYTNLFNSGFRTCEEYKHNFEDVDDDMEQNPFYISKWDENDKNLSNSEIFNKYVPNTIDELSVSVYMLRKLGFEYIYNFMDSMTSDSDYSWDIRRTIIQ